MKNWKKDVLKIIGGALFIYLGALVAFDLNLNETKIPITGQSLAVLTVGFLLGKKNGVIVVALYLLLGAIGLPIFAKGASGIEVFSKGSGGFLYGFLLAAYFIGWLQEIGFDENFWKCLIAMTLGTAIIIAFGVGHLTYLFGFEKALEYGFFPFWQGAIIKIFLGAVIVFFISKKVRSYE